MLALFRWFCKSETCCSCPDWREGRRKKAKFFLALDLVLHIQMDHACNISCYIVHTCRLQLGFFSSKLVTGSILPSTLTETCLLLPATLPCFSLKPLHVKDKSCRPSLTLISPGIYFRHLVQKLFIYVRVTWENRLLKVLPG